jgi:hypothetical protein
MVAPGREQHARNRPPQKVRNPSLTAPRTIPSAAHNRNHCPRAHTTPRAHTPLQAPGVPARRHAGGSNTLPPPPARTRPKRAHPPKPAACPLGGTLRGRPPIHPPPEQPPLNTPTPNPARTPDTPPPTPGITPTPPNRSPAPPHNRPQTPPRDHARPVRTNQNHHPNPLGQTPRRSKMQRCQPSPPTTRTRIHPIMVSDTFSRPTPGGFNSEAQRRVSR